MNQATASSTFRIRRPEVVSEVFEGEAVVVDLRLGRYYSLSPLAAELWSRLDSEPDLEALAACFMPRWATDARERVEEFLARLVDAELVTRHERSAGLPAVSLAPVERTEGEFEIESFTDLEELLVLDPIHELDENGWPKPPGRAEEPAGE